MDPCGTKDRFNNDGIQYMYGIYVVMLEGIRNFLIFWSVPVMGSAHWSPLLGFLLLLCVIAIGIGWTVHILFSH